MIVRPNDPLQLLFDSSDFSGKITLKRGDILIFDKPHELFRDQIIVYSPSFDIFVMIDVRCVQKII